MLSTVNEEEWKSFLENIAQWQSCTTNTSCIYDSQTFTQEETVTNYYK